jgi:hypothetical protein
MDTAAPDTRVVKLADAGELIAAIPSLLGFHPADSLLVVTLKDTVVGLTVRVDLPPPPLYAAVVGQLTRPLRQVGADAAVIVVCGAADPRHQELVQRAVAAVESIGLWVVHAVWIPSTAGGVPWRCFQHDDCSGEVPDHAGTEFAAEMALAGAVTFGSRDDIVRLLQPADPARMARIGGLLDVIVQSDRTSSTEHLATVRAAIAADAPPAGDEEYVRLALALSDYRVRDVCLGFALDDRLAPAAERLWLELARSLPPPERAEAATLLAVSSYLRGDGALANVALAQAQESLPSHNLAGLLRGALDYGIPVVQIRQVLSDAAADARIDIDEAEADMTD